MRTTLTLEDDALEAVQAFASGKKLSLGRAASELIRRGSKYQLGIKTVNGLPVFDVPAEFPSITSEQVKNLLDQE